MPHPLSKTLLIASIFVLGVVAMAQSESATKLSFQGGVYKTGPEWREHLLKNPIEGLEKFRIADEIGTFLNVPLDYENPSKGTTQIWTYTLAPFDAKKPSMIYINGGPGGWSRGLADLATKMSNWNVLYFDQRGTGFSKPATEAILRDRSYVSSRITAQDVDSIRKYYGIDKLSVYGHSYGTVVGTIYAHVFAAHTRALVIEGVVDHGESELWLAHHRVKRVQRIFNHLSKQDQDRIIELSEQKDIPPTWFHDGARRYMYGDSYEKQLAELLDAVLRTGTGLEQIRRFGNYDYMTEDTVFFGTFSFSQVACRELSMTNPESTWGFIFRDRKLVPTPIPTFKNSCDELGWSSQNAETYSSRNYPLTVPVTYLNGTTDGATVAPAAILHYKKSAKGAAQLILVPHAGHSPMASYFTGEKTESGEREISTFFEKALHGEFLSKDELKKLPNWKATRK